ncbi:hypothetical protein [Candidatus Enterovibrio altilux]|uniref:Mobile element protein n=1 Tax=Candidatus Enterovibrio altilux TaxID=1927128 RepID=A0A291B8U2_9GAMM|nr:hypothetical protein [Candidatus Enterovibrio luxaltus]ATF09387.1 Mobile element protein [Candidatus Enterovibrio luxaltus]
MININTHKIITAELSTLNMTDGEVLPYLLKQTHRRINVISGYSIDDTKQCYKIIRIK